MTPPARATAMPPSRPFSAGTTSSEAENGDLRASVSFAWRTPSTSSMPRSLLPTISPGVTVLPAASMIVAPAGAGTGADADDAPAVDDDGRVVERRAVAGHHCRVDDGERGGGERGGRGGGQQRGGEGREQLHLTSPVPGWPSSKSVRGRRCKSAASYITAPSIHTVSGRE